MQIENILKSDVSYDELVFRRSAKARKLNYRSIPGLT